MNPITQAIAEQKRAVEVAVDESLSFLESHTGESEREKLKTALDHFAKKLLEAMEGRVPNKEYEYGDYRDDKQYAAGFNACRAAILHDLNQAIESIK